MIDYRILIYYDQGLNHPDVITFCEQLYDEDNRSPHLQAFLADRAAELVEKDIDRKQNLETALEVRVNLFYHVIFGNSVKVLIYSFISQLYRDLAIKYDMMRAPYWNYLIDRLKKYDSH